MYIWILVYGKLNYSVLKENKWVCSRLPLAKDQTPTQLPCHSPLQQGGGRK